MAKQKIAILGGGMSSLTAAYHLTGTRALRERHDITVYQMGWRLGGKCASGRNVARGWRIEEHGLHVLFGWYENTFALIRGLYEELGKDWRQAFRPCHAIVAPEWVDGHVLPWIVKCPTNPEMEPGDGQVPTDRAHVIVSFWSWFRRQLEGWTHRDRDALPARPAPPDEQLRERIRTLRSTPRQGATGLLLPDLAERLIRMSSDWDAPGRDDHELLRFLTDEFLQYVRDDRWWQGLVKTEGPADRGVLGDLFESVEEAFDTLRHAARRLRVFVDFFSTALKGIWELRVCDELTWFDLDEHDLRDWLRLWGAGKATIESVIVDAIYGSVFSSGATRLHIGAGTILQTAVRAALFFKGACVYRPDGSIADLLFAPLYEVLRRRGVRFEFFHRVEELVLSPARDRVQTIRIARQAKLKESGAEYRPLLALGDEKDGQPVWPSRPIYEQLDEPETIRQHDLESWWDTFAVEEIELRAGEDFDKVVFGISIGALPELIPGAMSDPRNDRLQWTVRGVPTTQTQALQLWFEPRPGDPDWPGRLPRGAPVAIPYRMPFDTIADMKHILRHERAPQVSEILYLCAALSDDELPPPRQDREYPARQRARAERNSLEWIEEHAGRLLYPRSPERWRVGESREWLRQQFVHTPANPSDRYVLCPPGSVSHRLLTNQSGYQDLFLTGDWIRTAVSAGCLEAATMAGIQTARAIDGSVDKARGDWLPDPPPPERRSDAPFPLVFRDGDVIGQPPIAVSDLEQTVFLLSADESALQVLCDRELNLDPARRYRPLGPYVIFYAASLLNRVAPFGSAAELDFGFWVPLVTAPDHRIVFYSPYLWVNESWALVAGRELFGFPKHLGQFELDPKKGRFALSTWVLPRRGGTVTLAPVVEVRCAGTAPPGTHRIVSWAELAAAGIPAAWHMAIDHGRALASWLAAMVRQPTMPMVFLKQIPGPTRERRPCYRAIVEASIDMTRGSFAFTPWAGPFEITIHEYESHRIARTLGLRGRVERDRVVRITPETQAHMRLDAVVGPGKVIWRDDSAGG